MRAGASRLLRAGRPIGSVAFRAYAVALARIVILAALTAGSFAALAPSRSFTVHGGMNAGLQKLKICDAVIVLDAVFVVDVLTGHKPSSQVSGHDYSMLKTWRLANVDIASPDVEPSAASQRRVVLVVGLPLIVTLIRAEVIFCSLSVKGLCKQAAAFSTRKLFSCHSSESGTLSVAVIRSWLSAVLFFSSLFSATVRTGKRESFHTQLYTHAAPKSMGVA